jgi:hypothetical protein
MIADRLADRKPRLYIEEGAPLIARARLFPGKFDTDSTEETLYVGPADLIFENEAYRGQAALIHRRDMIFVECDAIEDLTNEIFKIMDHLAAWEKSIFSAAKKNASFQQIIDLSEDIILNPMLLLLMDRTIVARSRKYDGEFINTVWQDTINKSGSLYNKEFEGFTARDGMPVDDWTATPQEYSGGGINVVGFYLNRGNKSRAVFSIMEYKKQLSPADVQYAATLKKAFMSVAESRKGNPLRTSEEMLADIATNSFLPDSSTLNQLGMALPPSPWVLLLVTFATTVNTYVNRNFFLSRLQTTGCLFPFLVEDKIAAIVSETGIQNALADLKKIMSSGKFNAGVSLPFAMLSSLPAKYRHTNATIRLGRAENSVSAQTANGNIFFCRDYALKEIINLIAQDSYGSELTHSALDILELYDLSHNAALVETLRSYLRNDQNIARTAESLGLHRNSLVYRLERIKELSRVNLNDPGERTWLYISTLIREAKNAAAAPPHEEEERRQQ